MKYLIICSNRMKPPVMPIGVIYVATYLKKKGIDVKLVDMCFMDNYIEETMKEIEEFKPDLIGIGIRNIDNVVFKQSEFFVPEIQDIVTEIKNRTDTPIVLGGAGFSIFPKELLELLGLNYGIVGEGEKSTYQLCQYMQGKEKLENIAGLVYRNEDGVLKSNLICNMDSEELEDIPFPDYSLIDIDKYYYEGGVFSIQTKRGCALGCIYCTYPVIEGKNFRLRNKKSVVDEMEEIIKKTKLNYFYFVDSIVNVPFSHIEDICDEIVERKLDLNWFGYISPLGFTEERLQKMVRSGMDGAWFSVDTCSNTMLKSMHKGYDAEDINKALDICKKNNIRYNLVLLLGGPGETEETLNETFDFLEQCNPNLVIIMYGLRVYPGTDIYDITLKRGIVDKEQNLLNPVFYVSEEVENNIVDIIRNRTEGHNNWHFTPAEWNRKEKIKNTLVEKSVQKYYQKGVRGPFWAVVDKIQNKEV